MPGRPPETIEARLKRAHKIAIELNKKGGYWGWYIYQLTGWVLYQGVCVYCGTDISDPREIAPGTMQVTDHLLPYSKYPELGEEPLNMVPSCSTCNARKHTFDPSLGISEGIKLTRDDLLIEVTRVRLIQNARHNIAEKKRNDPRKDKFDQTDRANWLEAMQKWGES